MPPTIDKTDDSTIDQPAAAAGTANMVAGYESVADFTKEALKSLVLATRTTNSMPQDAARDLYCAYPTYNKVIDQQSQRVLGLISKVLKAHNIKGNIQRRLMDEQFELVQECNDVIFERLGINLDIKSGLRLKQQPTKIVLEANIDTVIGTSTQLTKNSTPSAGSWNRSAAALRSPIAARLIAAKNIERPQAKFKVPVDNSQLVPFVPRLEEKPNSMKPLAVLPEYDDAGNIVCYLHPYEFELLRFEPSAEQLERKVPVAAKSVEDTPLVYVDTVSQLQEALTELREAKEIAVDVEHHSYRTFMGITCLVQMSTRDKDYIFDTLALREDLHVLNLVLTDPKVVKILHGADLDVEWLQRDLSLYIVNMFDTHKAAKALNMARVSLAFLLKHYVNIDVDKTFQLADWRMRPLPEELIAYARQDTHYLIYIYEVVTNDLLDLDNGKTNTLRATYQQSTEVCKKRYVKPRIAEDSHMHLLRKSNRVFDNRQLTAFRDIFRWRDETARKEDESYGYVLPNHMMLQIAESLPREMQGILACCNPIPPPVRQQLHKLHDIVLRARDQPMVRPIAEPQNVARNTQLGDKSHCKQLYCPHDLSHLEELRDDLPTMLNFDQNAPLQPISRRAHDAVRVYKPAFALFEKPAQVDLEELYRTTLRAENSFKRMPYKRYLAILPFAEQEKRAEALRAHNEMKTRQLCPATPAAMLDPKTETQPNSQTDVDDMYRLPLKEQLKRKYPSTPGKQERDDSKRLKLVQQSSSGPQTNTPKDDKLQFSHVTALPVGKAKKRALPEPVETKDDKGKDKDDDDVDDEDVVVVASTSKSSAIVTISDDDDDDSDAPPKEETASREAPLTPGRNDKRKKSNNFKKFKDRPRLHAQSSNRPIATIQANANFDYGQVDFRKFRGGAQRARGTEVKAQHHGRNQPHRARNKQFSKLFTFSNVKGNKK